MSGAVNVRVFCRFRPFNSREKDLDGGASQDELAKKYGSYIKLGRPSDDGQRVDVNGASQHDFNLDRFFPMDTEQPDFYEIVGRPTVDDIMGGFNGTIFAYGQTGAGKSFSMMGKEGRDAQGNLLHPELAGIIPRAAEQVFQTIASEVRGIEFEISVSYLEVYKEVICDLLDPSKVNLKVREHPHRGVYVDHLTEEAVATEADIGTLLRIGDEHQHVSSTGMNSVSSRSHKLLMLKVKKKNQEDGSTTRAQLNLVDLAGSEKIAKTGASGQRLEEAKKINQSLSALSSVIKGLSTGAKHISFRDSKLTRILQTSLSGNTKTSLIVCASPHPNNEEETLATLRFAKRAKMIKTKVKANLHRSPDELQKLVDKLEEEVAEMRGYIASLEKKLKEAGVELPTAAEAGALTKEMSAAVVSGAGDARLKEENDKLKESLRIAQDELEDLKADSDSADAEVRQAQEAKATVEKHLARFQGLAKQAAGEIKGLRGELSEQRSARAVQVNHTTSVMLDLAEKNAECIHLKTLLPDSAEEASTEEDPLVAEMQKLRDEAAEVQQQMRSDYEAKLAAAQEENEKLKQQLAAEDVEQELIELRWLSDQTDKLAEAQRLAKTAEQRMTLANSAADQRVADAQDEAASRVAEAHANIEGKLQEIKAVESKRLEAVEKDYKEQLDKAKEKDKEHVAKARDLVLKQKAQWEERLAEEQAEAAKKLAAAEQQRDEQVAEATKATDERTSQLQADFDEKLAAAAKVATEQEETRVQEAQREAAEKVEAARTESETEISALRTRLEEELAAAKVEKEEALRTKEHENSEKMAKVVSESNDKIAAAEKRETDGIFEHRQRAQEEVAEIRENTRKELEAAKAEVEQAKTSMQQNKEAMEKREQEHADAAAQKLARTEKEKEDAIAAAKEAAAAELAAAAEQSKQEAERAKAEAEEVLQREKAELTQQAEVAAAAASAKESALETDNAQIKEQLEQLQQTVAQKESGASEMIGSIQQELSSTKTERDGLKQELATLTTAKEGSESAAAAAEAALKAKLEAEEAKLADAQKSFSEKLQALEEQSAAKVAEAKQQAEADIAAAKTLSESDASAAIQMANDDQEQAEKQVEALEAKLEAASAKLTDTREKNAEKLAEVEQTWMQRHTDAGDRAKADQQAHADEIKRLNQEWEAKIGAAGQDARDAAAASNKRVEEALADAQKSFAEKMQAKQAEMASKIDEASADQKIADLQRECTEKVAAAEKKAAEQLRSKQAELEQRNKKSLADAKEAHAAEIAAAKEKADKAREDANAELQRVTDEGDERVAEAESAAEKRIEIAKGYSDELESQHKQLLLEEQQKFRDEMSKHNERVELQHNTDMDEMQQAHEAALEAERLAVQKKVADAVAAAKIEWEAQQPLQREPSVRPGATIARTRTITAASAAGRDDGLPDNWDSMGVLEKWKWRDQNVVNPDAPKSQAAMAGIARSASAVSDAVSEELSAKLSSAKAAAASVGAKSYTVEPEGAYMVHPQAGLVPGSLYMSDKNLTFKSQVGAGEINAKIPLAGIMHLTEPVPKELDSSAPLYASLCGGAPMATFRVTFVQTKSKMSKLATLGKDKGSGETTAVDYIVTADRAAELHGALEPFVGKDVVNKKGGLMGELSSKLSGGATPTGPAGGPGAAPSADTPPPPPGWELRDSTQYPGRQFYSHAATGKTSWTHPGAAEVAPAPAPPMPWDGQEITLTQPAEGGLGMNIDARCEINSVKPGSVSEVGGVKVGTTIVRMNGRRVKDRKDIVKIVKSLKPGDKVELLMHTPEQNQAMVASQVKVAVQHSARQEDGAEPELEAPRPRFQSKYRKIERSGSAPGDALMAAAKGGSFKGSANAVLAVARTSQLARSQVSANG